jgi:hypothetical protein
MPRHPPNALKTLDHSHCQYPSLPSRTIRSRGGYQRDTNHSAIDKFDKKDQLLEINPMALRLSGQSFARGLMSTPCDILLKALTAQRACAGAPSDRRRPSGLYWYTNPPSFKRIRTYLLFTISYRTSNRQTNVQQAANLVLSVMMFLNSPFQQPCQRTLVEADGIEPTTPCLQSRCSPS